MSNINIPTYNRRTKKLKWDDADKIFIKDNSKKMTVKELAEKYGRTEISIMSVCRDIGCGYITKNPLASDT